MRRESDIHDGKRTGAGRRDRDRLLAGEVQPLPGAVQGARRGAEQNRMLFLADELREAALAASGIEAFLVRVHKALSKADLTATELEQLLDGADLDGRMAALDDALADLVRSLRAVIG